ncbi:uncharacterized protein Dwil_GK21761 [Drosophila willistoni]|uniref:GK21761 n=1 Tax=Drosophila willistoni TaxID=7260 RepID=B4MPS9_DROWI|nr:uncharacterized protein LOC6640407 [Drosophila willistoni]EDW74118.1 uncharacterized protein Dwil_GK21761 [Drosophila willistoni]
MMLLRWFRISRNLVLESNAILLVTGIIFLADVYLHIFVKLSTLEFFEMGNYIVSLSAWMSWVRGLTLMVYIFEAILGIRMAKSPSLFAFAGYMLIGFILLIYLASIVISSIAYLDDFNISVDMLLQKLWLGNRFDKVESLFECCGKTGVIDYVETIENRTWSRESCCGMETCHGCHDIIHKFLWAIEKEIARDNIIVFIVLCIAMLIMLCHYKDAEFVDDPYESESSDNDDDDDNEPSTLKDPGQQ